MAKVINHNQLTETLGLTECTAQIKKNEGIIMTDYEIITNKHERPFLYGYEVPQHILDSDFDHLSEDEKRYGFICYRGRYYHTSDFVCTRAELQEKGWYGISYDSVFSVVVVSCDNSETYKIGLTLA